MKYIPILYSTEMVKAIYENRKSKTRRTKGLDFINDSFSEWEYLGIDKEGRHLMRNEYGATNAIKCPYGQPGEIHWVRETFANLNVDFSEVQPYFVYQADLFDEDQHGPVTWKPSIHMPKTAARFFLKVTDVRIEKLQDISEEDAIAEGILFNNFGYKDYLQDASGYGHPDVDYPHVYGPRLSYKTLWQYINGEESWDTNPWVWVISFERIDKPKDWPL